MNTTELTASYIDSTPVVTDAAGGVWYPGEKAAEECEASTDPLATAVRICDEDPMRGEWRQ